LPLVVALSHAQREMGISGGVAEIGVHHGRFFLGLHLTRETGERSVAIDLFEQQLLNVDASGEGDETAFRKNLRRHAGGDVDVIIVRANSTTLDGARVTELADGPIRLFSVDGGHTAEIVEHDMHTAADSLTPGGIIVGDDVYNFGWPGAIEGTLKFLDAKKDVVPFAIGFNKVLFADRDFSEKYRVAVTAAARARLWGSKTSLMHSEPVVVVWSAPPRLRARLVAKRALRRAD
jgi:hypothetical protein